MEHEAFSEKDMEAYRQLVRVVLRDFLPFVKQMFAGLFSAEQVEQLALSTPYSLRHRATPSSALGTYKVGVELNMQLDVKEIGEVIRGVAPEVFSELEASEQKRGVVMGVVSGAEGTTGLGEIGKAEEEVAGGVGGVEQEEAKEGVISRTGQLPTHLAVKQD